MLFIILFNYIYVYNTLPYILLFKYVKYVW